jgi:hypothetical protein
MAGPTSSSELRELQAPIKDRYRTSPESSLITLAVIQEKTERYCVVLQTWRARRRRPCPCSAHERRNR